MGQADTPDLYLRKIRILLLQPMLIVVYSLQ
jgi:hypothetical protein